MFRFVGEDLGVTSLRPRHVVSLLISSGVALLLPTFLMGGVLPLAAAAVRRGMGDLGRRVGRLYALNTVGAVLGSLVAGFVLAPLAGPSWSAVWVTGLAWTAGTLVLVLARGVRRAVPAAAVALVASTALLVVADPARPFLTRSHVFQGARGRDTGC